MKRKKELNADVFELDIELVDSLPIVVTCEECGAKQRIEINELDKSICSNCGAEIIKKCHKCNKYLTKCGESIYYCPTCKKLYIY